MIYYGVETSTSADNPTTSSPSLLDASKPLEIAIRESTAFHSALLSCIAQGVSIADNYEVAFVAPMVPNLYRAISANSELVPLMREAQFKYSFKGIQTIFKRICPVTNTVLAVLLCRGTVVDDAGLVFEVNPKSDAMASRVGESRTLELFSITELIEQGVIFLGPLSRSRENTICLFWDPRRTGSVDGGEEIAVYLAMPTSMTENNTLMNCAWSVEIGRIAVGASTPVDISASDLPEAPALEPTVVPIPSS